MSGWEDMSRTERVTMSAAETVGAATYSDSHSDNRQISTIGDAETPRGVSGMVCEGSEYVSDCLND